ncbi:MAG: ribulose-phosphate 3-epimerase [Candidatus Lindowbacteria bacterium]|nr:ribulose-phosphate 3-epimerase [Candidatus Lindowbacteria bacterium]
MNQKHDVKIAPSILACDFGNFASEVERCAAAGADYIHFDVMDNHFVPNLTFGAGVVKACRSSSKIPFDVHLMVSRPDTLIDSFIDAGADIITIHVESACDVRKTLRKIREANCKAGVTLKPGTNLKVAKDFYEEVDLFLVMSVEPGFGGQSFMPESVERVRQVACDRKDKKMSFEIEIDGGIDQTNRGEVLRAGADVLVSGSFLLGQKDLKSAIEGLRERV